MKIILYRDVPSLGEEGDVKTVADGYARNFLIPQKFAVPYTRATETELAQKQKAIARRKEEKVKAASGMKDQIEDLTMEIAVAAGENGKLFGSVTSAAIVDFLNSKGLEIERKKVELPDGGIKILGDHVARVKLYGGEEASLKISVSNSGEKVEISVAAPEATRSPFEDEDEDDEYDEAYEELSGGAERKRNAEAAKAEADESPEAEAALSETAEAQAPGEDDTEKE